MNNTVTVIDYDCGNLFSVARAVEQCGGRVEFAETPEAAANAERLILPGVGAFGAAMAALRQRHMDDAVKTFAGTGRPFLGICVGLQAMLDYSKEFGHHQGLGLIPGAVLPVPSTNANGAPQPVPHIGWARLENQSNGTKRTIFGDDGAENWAYFVHSFAAAPENPGDVTHTCNYGGHAITAAIAKDNLIGCQFHPEKSGPAGLAMIDKFLAL